MFCTKCGFKMDDDAVFCASCGTRAKTIVADTSDVQIKETKENVAENFVGADKEDEESVVEESFKNEQISECEGFDNTVDEKDENENVKENADIINTTMNSSDANNAMVNNVLVKKKYKFSFKRFLFSFFVIIASLAACVSVFTLSYSKMSMEILSDDENIELNEEYKMTDLMVGKLLKGNSKNKIIKMLTEVPEYLEDMDGYDVSEIAKISSDLKENAELIKMLAIVLVIVVIVATLINIILCCVLRKKVTYVFTLLFSLANMVLGGYIFYIFNFDILGQVCDIMNSIIVNVDNYIINIEVVAGYTLGAIVFMASQLVIFISSIILFTCKRVLKTVK